jgi:type II secretory pathway component PulF
LSALDAINEWGSKLAYKLQFTAETRKELYDSLLFQMSTGKLLRDAVGDLYEIHSDDGARPKATMAVVLQHVRDQVTNGSSFAEALGPYISNEEYQTLLAGEQAGNLAQAFEDATRVADAKGSMFKAMGAMLYPLVLIAMTVVLFWIISFKLVPALKSAADPKYWGGFAKALYYISEFTTGAGLPFAVAIVLAVLYFAYSLPRLTGSLRNRLDKLPGYATYRLMQGSIFLLNIAVLIRNGVKLHDALVKLRDSASPYLGERIDGAITGSTGGKTLGESLLIAGHDFPDRHAIRLIKGFGTGEGFEINLSRYATKWIDQCVKGVTRTFILLGTVVLLLVGVLFITILMGGQDIQDAVNASMNQ